VSVLQESATELRGKEAVMAYFMGLPLHFPEGTKESHKTESLAKIFAVVTDLSNLIQEHRNMSMVFAY
jgi:hypothetical protein